MCQIPWRKTEFQIRNGVMKMKKVLKIKGAPEAKGPYSTVVAYGDLLFVSGQGPINPDNGEVVKGDITVQTKQVLNNLSLILKEAGSSWDNVLKVVVYLTDMNNFNVVNALYKEVFSTDYPARTCVEVSNLPLGIDVEIDVIACKR